MFFRRPNENALLDRMEDENGRGEFDEDSDLLTAVERVIDWIQEEDGKLG